MCESTQQPDASYKQVVAPDFILDLKASRLQLLTIFDSSVMWFHWHLNHHLLIRWCTSQPQHFIASASQSFPIGQWFLIASFIFGNFRPSAGRALSGILMIYSIRSCVLNEQKGNAGELVVG